MRSSTLTAITALITFLALGALATTAQWQPKPRASAVGALDLDPLSIVLVPHGDLSLSDERNREIAQAQAAVRAGGPRLASLERLGWAFVAKARAADDGAFYELVLHCARAMDARFPDAPAARLLRGHTLHSLHRFKEAETIARALAAERGSPLDYALLGDVLYDQGRIEDAARAYRRLMRLRPDAGAYTRVAQIRRTTGDVEGAVEAMRIAARAVGHRNGETYAWTWSRLADLELQAGRFAEARAAAAVALDRVPNFAAAFLVIGKSHLAENRPDLALAPIRSAVRTRMFPEELRLLAETHRALGNDRETSAIESQLVATGALRDPRGLAAYLAETRRDPARALELARTELSKRRDVYTIDTLAMALLANGDVAGARRAIARVLSAGASDGPFFYHAGLIASAAGAAAEAREHFLAASKLEHTLLPSQRVALARRRDGAGNS